MKAEPDNSYDSRAHAAICGSVGTKFGSVPKEVAAALSELKSKGMIAGDGTLANIVLDTLANVRAGWRAPALPRSRSPWITRPRFTT